MQYRRDIDGLRAFAVVSVIFFHANFNFFSGGFFGVDVFFVISGFLISSIIFNDLKLSKFSLYKFYEKRARRILPALLLIIILSIPFALIFMPPGDLYNFSKSTIYTILFISNIFFWKESGYFDVSSELKPLIHTWSLSIEEQFYLFYPILLIFSYKYFKKYLLTIIIGVFFMSFALALWLINIKPSASFYLLPTRVFELLFGALTYFYFSKIKERCEIKQSVYHFASMLGLLLILYSVFLFDKNTPSPSAYTLIPIIGTSLIIVFSDVKTLTYKIFSNDFLVNIGLVSYSAYLLHQPIFSFIKIASDENLNFYISLLIIISIFILAFAIRFLVELPFRNYNRVSNKKFLIFLLISTFIIIFFAVSGILTKGFVGRYNEVDRHLASINIKEQGDYTVKNFNKLIMRKFDPQDGRKKILIIGDSFAQDLVNALHESEFQKYNQISTRAIAHECGNLFINRGSLENIIDKKCLRNTADFGYEGLYEDIDLRNLIVDADEIWFASAWHEWQARLIPESILNLNNFSAKKIKIFGRKSFGNIDIKNLLKLTSAERVELKSKVDVNSNYINNLIKSNLPADAVFIDLQKLMCGNQEYYCSLFDGNDKLISYDGSHLTNFGAKILGVKLSEGALKDYYK